MPSRSQPARAEIPPSREDSPPDLRRYYSEWWENPKDPRGAVFSKLNRLVGARLPVGSQKKALDLGPGRGTITALLVAKGFHVTCVEINEEFGEELRHAFPAVKVRIADAREADFDTRFDLVTAIEFVQNLEAISLRRLLQRLGRRSRRIHLNISNRRSLHGWWAGRRHFQLPFVHTYTPQQIEAWLQEAGFRIVYVRGVGLLTPITLRSGFRGKIVPVWLARAINSFGDRLFPRSCHLYYLEAEKVPDGSRGDIQ